MLRRWRERVAPSAVGLPAGGRRRATGLRREELAGLAGISPDYLTRLEQGRATSPSVQVVEALARGLRLADAERDLLYREAGHATPGPELVPSRISPSVQRLLDRFSNIPLVVYDATWNLLVANAPYDSLMGETARWHGIERNAIWRNFASSASRVVTSPDEQAEHQARLVADLRQTASRYPTDRSITRLVAELSAQSPRFVELWETGNADPGREPARRKIVDHPSVGRITLDCDTLLVAGDDIRLMIYTAAPDTADAERLALALVLGTQAIFD
jgi:transcriptional regulator with XRE-family HTH domain